MIEPVYFDTCLCFYFDKILTAQKIQNRGKYQKFSFSLLSGGGAPINPNELKVPKIPKKIEGPVPDGFIANSVGYHTERF